MDGVKAITDARHVRILMNPIRQAVLKVLRRNKEPMTVKQIAARMDLKPANVHFHVKQLEEIGVLELVRTEVVRGIVAKFYQPTAQIFKLAAPDIDPATSLIINHRFAKDAEELFEQGKKDFVASCLTGKRFARRISYTEMYLSGEEFAQLNSLVDQAMQDHVSRRSSCQRLYRVMFTVVQDEADIVSNDAPEDPEQP